MNARTTDKSFVSDTFCESSWPITGVCLVFGWTVSGAAFITSLWILPYDSAIALMVLSLTSVLVWLLWNETRKFTMQSGYRYEVLFTAHDVIIYTHDVSQRQELVQSLELADIRRGEYFAAGDFANLSLIGTQSFLEVPLSMFSRSARKRILQEVKVRGIKLIDLREQELQAAA